MREHVNKAERQSVIINMLKQENGLPVRLIASHLEVSHMTVRRDVEELASRDEVRLIHGGVILSPRHVRGIEERPYSLVEAEALHSDSKCRIGRRAADYIDDMDILIIDSGSTTEYLAETLPQDRNLTVMGFSLNIIGYTAKIERVESVMPGGLFHQNTLMFESREGLALIKRYRATKAFISAAGVSLDLGVTCQNAYERETKMAAIESSARRILLADSSKFGIIRSEYFADIEQFDMIITDVGLDKVTYHTLEERCIEVVLV